MTRSTSPASDPAAAQPVETSVKGVLWSVAGLAALVAASLVGMSFLLDLLRPEATPELPPEGWRHTDRTAPTPNETPFQRAQSNALRNAEGEWLSEFAWANEAHDRARIPIDRAMRRLAEIGLTAPLRPPEDDSRDTAN